MHYWRRHFWHGFNRFIHHQVASWLSLIIATGAIFALGSRTLPNGRWYQHVQAVRVADAKAAKKTANAVATLNTKTTIITTSFDALITKYGHTETFMRTVDDAGKNQVRAAINLIGDLDDAAQALDKDDTGVANLQKKTAALKDRADKWSDAVQ